MGETRNLVATFNFRNISERFACESREDSDAEYVSEGGAVYAKGTEATSRARPKAIKEGQFVPSPRAGTSKFESFRSEKGRSGSKKELKRLKNDQRVMESDLERLQSKNTTSSAIVRTI